MLRNRLYYSIKPLVPLPIRYAIRRWFAVRKRRQVDGVWPIMPGSEVPPAGWPGWPEGRQFAFVLTHDVEGQGGVNKCRQLMELEAKLGFRSSFNFIPEGDYRVSRELRDELTSAGFEVGVHDLHHDGRLYRSRSAFAEKAIRINRYLKEWGAAGFRSGFMLHNLTWLGDLDVLYDASTFDTDPFEPQPEGCNTIFPFWVPRNEKLKAEIPSVTSAFGLEPETLNNSALRTPHSALPGGYLELPYTLPQDSTLFLVLEERHPDIWFQKLDWVARHGGMALLNVHPDYVTFDGGSPNRNEFPGSHYVDLLQYVREKYRGAYWHALPRDVAETIVSTAPIAQGSVAKPSQRPAHNRGNSVRSGVRR